MLFLCHHKLFSPKSRLILFFLTGGLLFQRPWTPGCYWKGSDMSKGSIFGWNKASQSIYSLWYSALKMKTKARQGQGQPITPQTQEPSRWELPSSPCTHLSVIFLAVCRNRAWSFSFRECSAWEMSDADRSMHCLQFAICWASLRSLITLNKSMEMVTRVGSLSENSSGWTFLMCAFCCTLVILQ